MVKIRVGKPSTEFVVHEALLSHYSSYFRAALNSNFKEGRSKEIELLEDDAEIFKIFVHFLYTGSLYPGNIDATAIDENFEMSVQMEATKVWLLGDMRGVPALQNAAVDVIHISLMRGWTAWVSAIAYIYDRTSEAGPLRSLFVEFHTQLGISRPYSTILPRPAVDFFIESCDRHEELRLVDRNYADFGKFWKSVNMCQFHVHDRRDCKGREVTKSARKEASAEA